MGRRPEVELGEEEKPAADQASDARPASSGADVSDDTDVLPIELLPVPPPPPTTPPPSNPSYPPAPNQQPAQYPPPGYPPGYQQGYAPGYAPSDSPPPGYQPPGYQPGYGAPYGSAYRQQPYGYPGYPAYPRRGAGRAAKVFAVLMVALLVGLISLIAALAGGFVGYSDLARLVGMGPAEIYIQNLRDDPVRVSLERLDGEGNVVGSYDDLIGAADVRAYPNRELGPWDVRFVAADGTDLGTCHLSIAGNGRYSFMVLPDVVVVARAGQDATNGDDFVIQSSSLCRRTSP